MPIAQVVKFLFATSNNEIEYQAMLLGLRVDKELFVSDLEIYCDLQLVASQIHGKYEAKNEKIAQYLAITHSLVSQFTNFVVAQIPRSKN